MRRGGGGFVYMNLRPTQGMRASSFRTQECKGLRTSGQLNFIAFWTLVSKREEVLWLIALPAQKGDTL